jgi:PPK2 family polyphosphate:nucleotide phosphotransferase
VSQLSKFINPFRVDRRRGFRLKSVDPASTGRLAPKARAEAEAVLQRGVAEPSELQGKRFAQDRWAVLLVFQATDTAGKDGAIRHVISGVNPQGCQVVSFKAPSAEELDHDFLWRSQRALPERGRIGIFNRSYYEDVLVAKVCPEILAAAKVPPSLVTKHVWKERYQDIRAFERHLTRNGVAIRKFFLHVSKGEQKRRFLERLNAPDKQWKFNLADLDTRDRWAEYMGAYEDAISETASEDAPWFGVPADKKWFTRLVVAAAVIDALQSRKLEYPRLDARRQQNLETGRARLRGGTER